MNASSWHSRENPMERTRHLLAGIAPLFAASATFAHAGHGQAGAHWHATDAQGFIALAVIVAAALWASRRR